MHTLPYCSCCKSSCWQQFCPKQASQGSLNWSFRWRPLPLCQCRRHRVLVNGVDVDGVDVDGVDVLGNGVDVLGNSVDVDGVDGVDGVEVLVVSGVAKPSATLPTFGAGLAASGQEHPHHWMFLFL